MGILGLLAMLIPIDPTRDRIVKIRRKVIPVAPSGRYALLPPSAPSIPREDAELVLFAAAPVNKLEILLTE